MAALEFTPLERAALRAFGETFETDYPGLAAQLSIARPIGRLNSGGGFYTDLSVERLATTPLSGRSPIGDLSVDIAGLTYPLGLLLFHTGGYLHQLEGYSVGVEDTSGMDLTAVRFGAIRTTS